MSLYNPKGNRYNFEDPLGLLAKDKSIEDKLQNPNPVVLFVENEARKRDETRRFLIEKQNKYQKLCEIRKIFLKMINMVVTFETKRGYLHGRVTGLGSGFFNVSLRGTKESILVDFDEVLRLRNNYA